MADVAQPQLPPRAGGFFTFMKEGALVPTRNRGLFLPLIGLSAARSMAFFLVKTLGFRFFAATMDIDAYHGVDVKLLVTLLGKFLSGRQWILRAGAAYLVAHVTLGLAIRIATVFAAVMSCSGGLSSLLDKAKGNLCGPIVTVVFGEIMMWLYVGGVMLIGLLAGLLWPNNPNLLALSVLIQFLAALTFFYFDVLCSMAVIVSVAEPGRGGAAAVGRARRLMRSKMVPQAALYAAIAWTLDKAIWKMHALTMAWLPQSSNIAVITPGIAAILYLSLGALNVFCMATITVYYLECRTIEEKAGHRE